MLNQQSKYQLLKSLEQNSNLTQRQLSKELGISLGKVNYCLQSLILHQDPQYHRWYLFSIHTEDQVTKKVTMFAFGTTWHRTNMINHVMRQEFCLLQTAQLRTKGHPHQLSTRASPMVEPSVQNPRMLPEAWCDWGKPTRCGRGGKCLRRTRE